MTKDGRGRPRAASTEDVFEALRSVDEPVATATELAEDLDVNRATTLRRLDELRKEGRVERKEVGSNAVVWWPIDE
ncbi:transcriptional regulator [Natronococcus pandeyae]|uniref:Transcriptional regulator n=1 Tax=Natronococcus pandeyae TaxID=2055836 RepID=A0A8J8TNY3_9EURY|nr:HTH domain-containing protein [Natronococcus pandeyae]TYL37191.1 transcriptional regulator [Natronococcus pandeyae]